MIIFLQCEHVTTAAEVRSFGDVQSAVAAAFGQVQPPMKLGCAYDFRGTQLLVVNESSFRGMSAAIAPGATPPLLRVVQVAPLAPLAASRGPSVRAESAPDCDLPERQPMAVPAAVASDPPAAEQAADPVGFGVLVRLRTPTGDGPDPFRVDLPETKCDFETLRAAVLCAPPVRTARRKFPVAMSRVALSFQCDGQEADVEDDDDCALLVALLQQRGPKQVKLWVRPGEAEAELLRPKTLAAMPAALRPGSAGAARSRPTSASRTPNVRLVGTTPRPTREFEAGSPNSVARHVQLD